MGNNYKNCIGAHIRIKFDNDVVTYLKKDERTSISFEGKIVSVEKYSFFATLVGDSWKWTSVGFEVDNSKCIREVSPGRESSVSSVRAIF